MEATGLPEWQVQALIISQPHAFTNPSYPYLVDDKHLQVGSQIYIIKY